MNVTMYQTNDVGEFIKTPLFPSVPMSGAKTLTDSGEVIAEDFLGFGVAITGSSCYELATMTPEARRALLIDLYTKEGVGLSVGRLTVGSSDYSAELPDVAIEMCYFPKSALPMETALFRNPDGSRYFVLVNRDTSKRQVQLALDGQMWYAEILPNTLATIAVEESS